MNATIAAPDSVGTASERRGEEGLFDGLLAESLLALAAHQGLGLGVKRAEDGRYLMANVALAELLGSPGEALAGRCDADLLPPASAALMRAADHTALAHGSLFVSEHRVELRGERREFQVLRLAGQAALPGAGQRLVCSIWRDLAPQRQRDAQLRLALDQLEQLQKAHEALRREATGQGSRDPAGVLYSRPHFDDQMRRELDLSSREHREFALVYMALDAYGEKVRQLGTRAHDCICDAMGRLLRGNTRAMDASCRLDDRHFAVLLSGVGLATAHSRMEGLRRQCATQIVMLDGQELSFTVSMGVASFPHTARSQQAVTAACSAALAEAQRRGGNTVALASIRFDAS